MITDAYIKGSEELFERDCWRTTVSILKGSMFKRRTTIPKIIIFGIVMTEKAVYSPESPAITVQGLGT